MSLWAALLAALVEGIRSSCGVPFLVSFLLASGAHKTLIVPSGIVPCGALWRSVGLCGALCGSVALSGAHPSRRSFRRMLIRRFGGQLT